MKTATRSGTVLLAILLMGGTSLTAGCSAGAEAEGHEANLENLTIKQYLASQEIDPAEVRIEGDEVWVSQDAHFGKAELLAEIEGLGFQSDPGQSPQGYYYSFTQSNQGGTFRRFYHAPRAANTHFRFDASVPEPWRNAFRYAAAQWGSASSTDCVGFREGTDTPGECGHSPCMSSGTRWGSSIQAMEAPSSAPRGMAMRSAASRLTSR